MHNMTKGKLGPTLAEAKALLVEDRDFLRPRVQAAWGRDDRSAGRRDGRTDAGTARRPKRLYERTLITRVGKLELRVPQDRQGRFSTEPVERCQRSAKALVAALVEM
jgi:putative transposase